LDNGQCIDQGRDKPSIGDGFSFVGVHYQPEWRFTKQRKNSQTQANEASQGSGVCEIDSNLPPNPASIAGGTGPNISYIHYLGGRSGSAPRKEIFSIRSFSPKEM